MSKSVCYRLCTWLVHDKSRGQLSWLCFSTEEVPELFGVMRNFWGDILQASFICWRRMSLLQSLLSALKCSMSVGSLDLRAFLLAFSFFPFYDTGFNFWVDPWGCKFISEFLFRYKLIDSSDQRSSSQLDKDMFVSALGTKTFQGTFICSKVS